MFAAATRAFAVQADDLKFRFQYNDHVINIYEINPTPGIGTIDFDRERSRLISS
jgi:hypothetical protein